MKYAINNCMVLLYNIRNQLLANSQWQEFLNGVQKQTNSLEFIIGNERCDNIAQEELGDFASRFGLDNIEELYTEARLNQLNNIIGKAQHYTPNIEVKDDSVILDGDIIKTSKINEVYNEDPRHGDSKNIIIRAGQAVVFDEDFVASGRNLV